MFKKFKDKLAEEVKSSPQRLQQFAQAAQAAVTSASSSVSDITNNDLFSIGDNDSTAKGNISQNNQSNIYVGTSIAKPENMPVTLEAPDYHFNDNQRHRRLSNSSFSSDISFRLPSYESPSMYHLQSDMEVSASEAEEKSSFGVNLDRVTKEQLYGAYRRTQDRCSKYKSQYSDLARHYKLLERENAKARNVLVETQDKALRRISELREQCSLEQSAKAHLEQVLRTEIEEKDMKIKSLSTNLSLMQTNDVLKNNVDNEETRTEQVNTDTVAPLINLENCNQEIQSNVDTASLSNEVMAVNKKLEKMEQLLNKYKESLKLSKEKNSQLATEIKILSTELEKKTTENEHLQEVTDSLRAATNKIDELNEKIEELENKNNSLEFLKNKETSILEINLKNDQEEIVELKSKIEILSKREEEYAISLAENKLSIHKELESKESEIKTLKESLTVSQNEITTLQNIVTDYKTTVDELEKEQSILTNSLRELDLCKNNLAECQKQLDIVTEKCKSMETLNNKSQEEYKCLQLQLKQESAEKLAMIDRNSYLESRNAQLVEENSKKNNKIKNLENDLEMFKHDTEIRHDESTEKAIEVTKLNDQVNLWKKKCNKLESEIQDERIELGNLQAEIEKLLQNHEILQKENHEMSIMIEDLKKKNLMVQNNVKETEKLKSNYYKLKTRFVDLRNLLKNSSEEIKLFKASALDDFKMFNDQVNFIKSIYMKEHIDNENTIQNMKLGYKSLENDLQEKSEKYSNTLDQLNMLKIENENLRSEIEQSKYKNEQEHEKIITEQKFTLSELIKSQEEYKLMQTNIYQAQKEKSLMSDVLSKAQNRNDELLKKNEDLDKETKFLKDDLQKKSALLDDTEERLSIITKNYNELQKKSALLDDTEERLSIITKNYNELLEIRKENEEKAIYLLKLEKEIEILQNENLLLKMASEKISSNLEKLEIEMKEVKESHSQIEIEKGNLSSIIEKLEQNNQKLVEHKETQSDSIDGNDKNENNSLLDESNRLSEKILIDNEKFLSKNNNDTIVKDNILINENEMLKTENKRLQSDIEGLQIYMTKVSKENDELNNKIRDLIASSEKSSENIHIDCLKEETHSKNEKIENLLRENCLLVEENLELKDQLRSETTDRCDDTLNKNNNRSIWNNDGAYKKLADDKRELETRLKDLEDMNFTVNKDMLKMQENNKKLKLSNEKLERKLDEALVSLRHLHSLQENTELEYLKNILFEYLTGTGTHSFTLAKVLAAVVKFDDKQTDIVLQKEKERQGLLRQLGII